MIEVTCSHCKSQLRAKPTLAGRTCKCPKCGTAVQIPAEPISADVADAPAPASVATEGPAPASPLAPGSIGQEAMATHPNAATPAAAALPDPHARLHRLNRQYRYLVCGEEKLVAYWEAGQGWQVATSTGLVAAVRNPDAIPSQGDFRLVELRLGATEAGHRLTGIAVWQLAQSWALRRLARNDDAILEAVTGPAGLLRQQKDVVRSVLREHFMREVWADSHAVVEYLNNTDHHSLGVG